MYTLLFNLYIHEPWFINHSDTEKDTEFDLCEITQKYCKLMMFTPDLPDFTLAILLPCQYVTVVLFNGVKFLLWDIKILKLIVKY